MASKFAFIFISVSVVVSCLAKEVNITQVGGIRITNNGKIIQCDTLTCPENTHQCIVTKKSISDNKKFVIHRLCYGRNGQILAEKHEEKNNSNPNEYFDEFIQVGADGSTILNNEEGRKLAREIISTVQNNIDETMKNMQQTFKHAFSRWPFTNY